MELYLNKPFSVENNKNAFNILTQPTLEVLNTYFSLLTFFLP